MMTLKARLDIALADFLEDPEATATIYSFDELRICKEDWCVGVNPRFDGLGVSITVVTMREKAFTSCEKVMKNLLLDPGCRKVARRKLDAVFQASVNKKEDRKDSIRHCFADFKFYVLANQAF
jgi:hypothetical protein